jgi:hypothetical protein
VENATSTHAEPPIDHGSGSGSAETGKEFKNLSSDTIAFMLEWEKAHNLATHTLAMEHSPTSSDDCMQLLPRGCILGENAGPPKLFFRTFWRRMAVKVLQLDKRIVTSASSS